MRNRLSDIVYRVSLVHSTPRQRGVSRSSLSFVCFVCYCVLLKKKRGAKAPLFLFIPPFYLFNILRNAKDY